MQVNQVSPERAYVDDVIPDSRNSGYFLTMGAEEVGRIDAESGGMQIFETPTYARRG